MTTEETIQSIKQSVKERQNRIKRQRAHIRKMKENINKVRLSNMKSVTDNTMKSFQQFILHVNKDQLSANVIKCSDVLLDRLSKFIKYQKPERESCELVDRIFLSITDKTALWMTKFVENSEFKNLDLSMFDGSKCKNLVSYPIGDCYPTPPQQLSPSQLISESELESESENDVESDLEIELSETTQEENVPIDSPKETEKKLSFLRDSQIKFDASVCREIFGKISQLQVEKASKQVEKEQKKEKRNFVKKLAKSAKKKGKKGGLSDCLGDLNKKPQWEVEWIEKSTK